MNLPGVWGVYKSDPRRGLRHNRGHDQRDGGTTQTEQHVDSHMRTAVIVLGDLGLSPRMQNHALSLAEAGHDVDLIGLEGSPPMGAVANHPRIHCHRLSDGAFKGRARGGVRRFVLASTARAAGHGVALLRKLMRVPKPDVILAQVPPAVPTLAVASTAARLRGARLVIDWHNLSHTIAAVRLGESHRAVKSISRSERRWARRAGGHLSVSQALADWLLREYKVKATVLYDRPPNAFTRQTDSAASELWARLAKDTPPAAGRPPLVVSPTSWTLDEDFDLLLEALERADRRIGNDKPQGSPQAPDLAVVLSGRGPLRDAFNARLARRHFKHLSVRTDWVEPADYPTLIGMADLGVCLHQSSSGLDLPMKLADFRGASVPVAAFDYAPVIGEVLTTGREGVLFRDPGELASVLVAVATKNSDPSSALVQSRAWLREHPAERWEDHWRERALTLVTPGMDR